MALPVFNSAELLPDGIHAANQAELEARCVSAFTKSVTRPTVYAGLVKYQAALAALGLNVTQWVDGSFVDSSRLDPEDIDLVNFTHSKELNELDAVGQMNATRLMEGREATKPPYHCHTFLVVQFPDGHPLESKYDAMRKYWRAFFSHARDYRQASKPQALWRGRKGLVEMHVGDANLSPVVSHVY